MSSAMVWRAASLISSGAAKSGKPCERFTAPCFIARRVISRMTDSVNCSALAESIRREILAMVESGAVIAPSQADNGAQQDALFQGTEKKGNTCFPFSAGVAGGRLRRLAGLTINHPVELRVSQDDLHVFAGFRERNGLDEFGNLFVVALGFPGGDTVLAGIVRGSSRFRRSELLDQVGDIHHAELDIVVGIEELV